ACDESTQNKVAKKLGYSGSLISQVLRRNYAAKLGGVEEAVRGVYMRQTVECPALGTIPSNECRQWRRKADRFQGTNTLQMTPEQHKIIEMAQGGEPPAEIARRLGVHRQKIYKTLRKARDAGTAIPLFRRGGPVVDTGMKRLSVDRTTYAALEPIAAARGLSV
ncbi:sigma factor-like helix-turn-helix DNA-binding protein, partial [Profundibacterium mesophilum]